MGKLEAGSIGLNGKMVEGKSNTCPLYCAMSKPLFASLN